MPVALEIHIPSVLAMLLDMLTIRMVVRMLVSMLARMMANTEQHRTSIQMVSMVAPMAPLTQVVPAALLAHVTPKMPIVRESTDRKAQHILDSMLAAPTTGARRPTERQ